MKEQIKNYKIKDKALKNYIKDSLTLKKAPTLAYNNQIYNRANTTKFDIEKAHFEAELLLDEEEDSQVIRNESILERKRVSIFKFYCHLFEPIDWLYFILGILGLMVCGLANPVFSYLNATVFSEVGNTSENRGSLSEEELMKLNLKETMNSNIKKQVMFGAIALVGGIVGYFFIGLFSTRCLYNFKKKYFRAILSQEQGWFDLCNVFEFASKIQAQLEYIELGFGEGLCVILIDIFVAIAEFIFSFLGSWKLSLVVLCLAPIAIVMGIIYSKINLRGNTLVRKTWELAGGIGEEIFYNIKTVASFANFEYELQRFYEKVEISNRIELKTSLKLRLITASFLFLQGIVIFLTIIYGRTLVKKRF